MNRHQTTELQESEAEIIRALKFSGDNGLSKTVLVKKSPSQLILALLALERQGEIGNLGSQKKSCYVLLEGQDLPSKSLQLAKEAILEKATPGKPKLFSKSALEKGLQQGPRKQVMNALSLLTKEKKLIPLKQGRGLLYLHFSALADYFPLTHKSDYVSSVQPSAIGSVDKDKIRACYDQLVEKNKSVYITIAELQENTSIPIEKLKVWLLGECRQHRAIPGKGEYTLATESELAAAISVYGEPHLYVKFIS